VTEILSNVTNLLIFVAILGVLVFVHELGHFAVAKRLGIPVFEFGFGFPPRVWRFRKDKGWLQFQSKRIVVPRDFALPQNLTAGSRVTYKTRFEDATEVLTDIQLIDPANAGSTTGSIVQAVDPGTEYTLNAIPIGGFVRLVGEEDPFVQGGFASAKPSVRAPILLAGVTMNFILAFLVFTLTAFFSPPYATVQTTRIAGVSANSPAAQADLRIGDTITAINGQDVKGNYPALSQALRTNAGREITLTVVRGSQTLDPIKATPRVQPPPGEGPLGIALSGFTGLRVSNIEPGSPAERAGIRPGDVFVFLVDPKGRALRDQKEFVDFTTTHPNWKIDVQIARDNMLHDSVTLQIPEAVNSQNAALGLTLETSLIDAPIRALQEMGQIVSSIPQMFGQLFAGTAPANSFVGPLGIYQITGEVAQRGGVMALLELMGLLSLNLAVVNLFPLPGLDGGRLVFVVLEWLRGGKKIDPQKEAWVHFAGLALLVGLMILISFFDVQRMLAGQKILP